MLMKSKWQWIHMINHMFFYLILLNHMFHLGSADSNEDQISTLNTLKQMADNLKVQLNYRVTNSGQFNRPNSNNLDKLNTILNRLKSIEQNMTILGNKDGDSENVKIRINELENEMETIRKSLDNIFKESITYEKKLEDSLANITTAYNSLAERLTILEEPRHLKELEEHLENGNYLQAKLNADSIRDNVKIIEVMKKIYKISKDLEGYLYFAGIVNNLSRRLLIYKYIYNDIILKKDYYKVERYSWKDNIENYCIPLKLVNKLKNTIMNVAPKSADIYQEANNLTDSIVGHYFDPKVINSFNSDVRSLVYENGTELMNVIHFMSRYYQDYTSMERIYFVENIDEIKFHCWFQNTIHIESIYSIVTTLGLPAPGSYFKFVLGDIKLDLPGEMFLISVRKRNYDDALSFYKKIKPNKDAIKQYYKVYNDIESMLNFTNSLEQNDRLIIYSALYDAIDKTDFVYICDLLKLHDSLINLKNTSEQLTMVNNVEKAITSVIKIHFRRNTLAVSDMDFIERGFNWFSVRSKNRTRIAHLSYHLVKNKDNNRCYFVSKISLNDYHDWHKKYMNTPQALTIWNDVFYFLANCRGFYYENMNRIL
ncbi:hypothetical protein O3M35_003062 [Rhynocoris fuscipes]|uniref:Uncharacterized protein n=1 Tax=Rhynocoris fuscipes TaxID=488301 RepID=A0AAW1CNP9_9HEMI